MLVTKLRQVKPSSCKDKLGMPNIRIPISVPRIQRRALTRASLRLREKTDSNRPFIVRGPWQQLLHKGGHSYNGGILPRRIVDLVTPKRKESSKGRYALRLACTINPSDNELSLMREQREAHQQPFSVAARSRVSAAYVRWPWLISNRAPPFSGSSARTKGMLASELSGRGQGPSGSSIGSVARVKPCRPRIAWISAGPCKVLRTLLPVS